MGEKGLKGHGDLGDCLLVSDFTYLTQSETLTHGSTTALTLVAVVSHDVIKLLRSSCLVTPIII